MNILDILISQYISVNAVIALFVLLVVYVLHRIVRRFNNDMRWVYAEYNKLQDETDRLRLENLRLQNENTKLKIQVLKSLDKLDIERTK